MYKREVEIDGEGVMAEFWTGRERLYQVQTILLKAFVTVVWGNALGLVQPTHPT